MGLTRRCVKRQEQDPFRKVLLRLPTQGVGCDRLVIETGRGYMSLQQLKLILGKLFLCTGLSCAPPDASGYNRQHPGQAGPGVGQQSQIYLVLYYTLFMEHTLKRCLSWLVHTLSEPCIIYSSSFQMIEFRENRKNKLG